MKLYDYYRSTAAYRVRIALNLKHILYEPCSVHLLNQGGEQFQAAYQSINPQSLVPSLVAEGHVLTQSLAIIEYLDETHPEPPLLPHHPIDKADVRSLAQMIACDIHPLNNLRVQNMLKSQFSADDAALIEWMQHWMTLGFNAIEQRLEQFKRSKPVCYGEQFSLADLCLIPQVYNAKRYHVSLKPYPLICAINDYCLEEAAFQKAAPES